MKKLTAFVMAIALILGLAACGTTEAGGNDTQSSEPVSSSGPDEAVYEPGSPESIIPTVITDPELTYQEDTASLTGNNGAEIGTEETARQSVEDGVEFSSPETDSNLCRLPSGSIPKAWKAAPIRRYTSLSALR